MKGEGGCGNEIDLEIKVSTNKKKENTFLTLVVNPYRFCILLNLEVIAK